MPPIEKSPQVKPLRRIPVFVQGLRNLLMIAEYFSEYRIATPRGKYPNGVKQRCLPNAVLASNQGYAAQLGYCKFLYSAEACNAEIGEV